MSATPVRGRLGKVAAVLLTCLDVTDERRRFATRKFLADVGNILNSSLDYVAALRKLARLAVPTLADWCVVDLLDRTGELERVAVENADARVARAALQFARRNPPSLSSEPTIRAVIGSGRPKLLTDIRSDRGEDPPTDTPQSKLLRQLGVTSAMVVPLVAHDTPLGVISFLDSDSGRRFGSDDLEVAKEIAARAALVIENSRLFHESQAATEAKSDFLAVMSHELRTPLTAIIGYSELIQLGVPDPVTPRQHEQAERIEVAARHLLQLIEEILTLVTLESGERRVQRDIVDVNKLLRRAVSVVEPMARAKNIPLSLDLADDIPMLRSDLDKLLQVMLNLLSNAVKFTDSGTIQLRAAAEEGSLTIEVVDSGIGIEMDHLQRIFEPFWQAERPITRRAGGTGLGLTISRRLADLLGADLEVESAPGTGSTFRLRMPL